MPESPPRAGAAKELQQQGQELAVHWLPGHGTQDGHGDEYQMPRVSFLILASQGCPGKLQVELWVLCSPPLL